MEVNFLTHQALSSRKLYDFVSELVIGDQVAGIAGLKTQLQVPGTTTSTSTADVSLGGTVNGAEEMEQIKPGEVEATSGSPLNGAKKEKVKLEIFHRDKIG